MNKQDTMKYWIITFQAGDKAVLLRSNFGSNTPEEAKLNYIRDYKGAVKSDLREINSMMDNLASLRARLASIEALDTEAAIKAATANGQ